MAGGRSGQAGARATRADLPGGLRKTLADDAASSGECAMRFDAVATASAHAGHLQPSFLVQVDAMGGAPFSYCDE